MPSGFLFGRTCVDSGQLAHVTFTFQLSVLGVANSMQGWLLILAVRSIALNIRKVFATCMQTLHCS